MCVFVGCWYVCVCWVVCSGVCLLVLFVWRGVCWCVCLSLVSETHLTRPMILGVLAVLGGAGVRQEEAKVRAGEGVQGGPQRGRDGGGVGGAKALLFAVGGRRGCGQDIVADVAEGGARACLCVFGF